MARIYRAEHEGLRRSVALKVLLDGFAQDPEGHERFLREGRIAAAIKHPNVVNIFDVGFQDSTPYLVMELLEGQDLEALMYSQGSMPEAALVDIIVPIVAGLAAVHDAGVIHRDLKPGNIFLARSRNDEIEPKLLDFGISKAAESEQFKLTTARGLLMGTPLYMSPEGIQGGEITPLSDQYSLGVVLYECCTGFNPFAADTLAETVRRVTMGDFPPVSQQNPAVSKRMARIIGRAMSLDPSHRFSGLREMGRELLYLAGQRTRITWSLSFGEVAPKRTSGTVSLSPTPATPAPSRGYGTLGSVAAIVFGVALFGLAGVLLWPSRDEDDAVNPAVALQSLKGGAQATELPPPARPVGRDLAEPQGAPLERAPNVQPPAPSGQTTAAVAAPPTPAPSAPSPEPAAPPSSASSAPAKKEAEPARSNGDRVRAALNGGGRSSERGAERSTSERTSSERGAEGNGARGNARQAASRRRVPQRAPAPARAEATPAEEPKKPDWIVAKPAPVVERRPSTAVGTNNAPIFE